MKIFTFIAAFLCFLCEPVVQAAPLNIPENVAIQDGEIESWLQEIVEFCFQKLGVKIKPKVYVLNSRDFNAMATYGGVVIVTTAAFAECDYADQLFGILLHEGGHVLGGHLARSEIAAEKAMLPMLASTLLGGAAALATGNPAPLMMGAASGSQMAERSMAMHSRGEETCADTAAINILGSDSKYLVEVLTKLEKKMSMAGVDKYMLSHPLTTERIEAARMAAQQGGEPKAKLTELQRERFMWIKHKIRAYSLNNDQLSTTYANPKTDAEKYGQAISFYRQGKTQEALDHLKPLISKHPQKAFVYELMGQICMETNQVKEALVWLNKAHNGMPKASTINIMLALAIMEGKQFTTLKKPYEKAIKLLTTALANDRQSPTTWQLLARAYGEQSMTDYAAACQAQVAYIRDDLKLAKRMAEKGKNCPDKALAQQSKDLLEAMKQNISAEG